MSRYEEFIKEKQYLQNVSEATLSWYEHARKWLPNENPTEAELKAMVIRMREAGLKPTGCNAAIRAINAYLHWNAAGSGRCSSGCRHVKVSQLKEPKFVPELFTDEQVKLLIRWKPSGFYERRLHLLVLILLDTACRISESLNLRVSDCDLDNLIMLLNGKGRKQRRVPFSFELRRVLYKFIKDYKKKPHDYLLSSGEGRPLGRCVCLRDVKRLCTRLHFPAPRRTLHAFRHTSATNCVKRGYSTHHLMLQLGHSSAMMAHRYVSLCVEDLQQIHPRASLLSTLR